MSQIYRGPQEAGLSPCRQLMPSIWMTYQFGRSFRCDRFGNVSKERLLGPLAPSQGAFAVLRGVSGGLSGDMATADGGHETGQRRPSLESTAAFSPGIHSGLRRPSQDSTAVFSPVRRTGLKGQTAGMMPQMLEISEHAVFGNGSGMRGTEAFLKELEYRPDEAKPIKEGILQKRVVSQDILWSDRYITLTTEKIFIRNTKDREVRDTIGVCPKGGSHAALCSKP